ncbi:hypothetical protein MSAN_01361500 [Mycena sanguinolenta]|uniref:Uncharacterized protein n=1 Tax=Mycena sanguinolenta TaxID=230812 RepID=A0A8H6YG49_9AGAR|nr:hypothetical protein MSAN_01361500 [Mycena sanguinolenta]
MHLSRPPLHAKSKTEKDDSDRERPLLYTFPVITRTNADRPTDRPTPERQSTASLSLPPMSHKPPPRTHRRTHTHTQLETPPTDADVNADPAHAIRSVPRHKITGFALESDAESFTAPAPVHVSAPQTPARASPATKKMQREKPRTAPRRRRSASRSFSSSRPWLLPGGGGASVSDDELSRSFDLDSGAGGLGGGGGGGDFTQYLLRRIDSQKPLYHSPAFQAMMSVSVR